MLLAHEPTGDPDKEMHDEIIGLLEGLWRDRDPPLIIVTHDMSVAAASPARP